MKKLFSAFIFALLLFPSAARAESASLTAAERDEILLLLKACADVARYDAADYDEHELMRRILYTSENFRVLSDLPLNSGGEGKRRLVSAAFIDDAAYKAFRLRPEHPGADRLTELGYCYVGGIYYYTGGYIGHFATDIKEITAVRRLSGSELYVEFDDTFTDAKTPLRSERSSAVIDRDADGIYLKALYMGGVPSPETAAPENADRGKAPLERFLPAIILLLALAASAVVFYAFILK